jgi:uncharacterized protein (UPF0371 family)
MDEQNLSEYDRNVVAPARTKAKLLSENLKSEDPDSEETVSAMAIELPDGTILTGKSSELMSAPAAAILNAVKYLANVPDSIHLLSPLTLEPILNLKQNLLAHPQQALNLEEVILALSISGTTNPVAHCAIKTLSALRNCQAHSITMLEPSDDKFFKNLGVECTCDPKFPSAKLYYNN